MSEWKNVSILKETWLLINSKKGDKTFGDYMQKAVTQYSKVIDKLNQAEIRIKELEEKAAPTQIARPQSDVPSGMPDETNPAKQALFERLKREKPERDYEADELPIPPCPFCSKGRMDTKLGYQLVWCAHKKYRKPTELAFSVCVRCWERKEYMKNKNADQQEEQKPEIAVPDCPKRSRTYKTAENDPDAVHDFGAEGKQIYCIHDGSWRTVEYCQKCFSGPTRSIIDVGTTTDVAEETELEVQA